jgi:hypothetical protein
VGGILLINLNFKSITGKDIPVMQINRLSNTMYTVKFMDKLVFIDTFYLNDDLMRLKKTYEKALSNLKYFVGQ